jgi:hypothetical protein
MCVVWLVFFYGVPLPFPVLLAYFPRSISVVVCFGHPLPYAALSTWQGTDHPHVCPPLGGPAAESVPARTAHGATQHSVTPTGPGTAESVPARTAHGATQHSVTPTRPDTAESVPARRAHGATQHSVTPAHTCSRAEPTVGGWCVMCGAWATRDK